MPPVTVTAAFQDVALARAAVAALGADGISATLTEGHEGSFLKRFVLIVVLWSIVGTAAGAALGAGLSYTVGPHGTEGLILLVVTWAIFAHLLIGMWAGYVLLSDRSRREMTAGETTVVAQVEESQAVAVAARLKGEGASVVTAIGEAAAEPARK